MAEINSKSFGAEHRHGNIDDPVPIRFTTPIGEYKVGPVYTVDGSLAHHFCSVMGVAESASPPKPMDRAMQPPPRGRSSTKTKGED